VRESEKQGEKITLFERVGVSYDLDEEMELNSIKSIAIVLTRHLRS
jgi:hypothetical protein